jgi:hypothetical protein
MEISAIKLILPDRIHEIENREREPVHISLALNLKRVVDHPMMEYNERSRILLRRKMPGLKICKSCTKRTNLLQ